MRSANVYANIWNCAMSLSKDFVEFIEFLNARQVDYLLVGGHALAFHGLPRFTKDIDFWTKPSLQNARRILRAIKDFGFSDVQLGIEDFSEPGKVIQLGIPPNRIDLVTSIDGVEFDLAFRRKITSTYKDIPLHVINVEDLIVNKRSTGREQDILDAQNLEKARALKK
jgi:hypothetical protein